MTGENSHDAKPRRASSRTASLRSERLTFWLAVIQLVCAFVFLFDLIDEFPDPRYWRNISPSGMVHLITELTIMGLLLLGVAMARRSHLDLVSQRDGLERNLRSLREDFDGILTTHFQTWDLTPAQRDVALLCLRGLRIKDIASLRKCAEGTVKAHMSAVFRAAGVRTRGEFVGLFMEEFLDHGSTFGG
ncbi:helix-turn-helix transcriptional regulator [uncultured Roseovarius sp.]|jgi:DNA-binding CsgD family transcriptional regulator|uniref:helix-turn-helix transcriptional regulator n=1 Tax=uncultured Roseovarius sp. TaxID=293344 RepID=UPI00261D4B51|nr:helix-turn-helix transcriptional regulator [uncultured Roseovarius sp.]